MAKKSSQRGKPRQADAALHVIRPLQQTFDFLSSEDRQWLWSPAFLAQTCLPYSEVKEKDLKDGAYVRRNGDITMEVRSAIGAPGIPYGKLPRLFLIWLANTVKYRPDYVEGGWLRIKLPFTQFCRQVGVDPSRGHRGSGRALVEQMRRLMTCDFLFKISEKSGDVRNLKARRFAVTTSMDMTWIESESQPKQWLDGPDSGFRLSQDFLENIQKAPMMLRPEHVALICKGKSPLRLDAYLFLAYRNYFLLIRNKQQVPITWHQLRGQLGSSCEPKEFVRSFRKECAFIKKNVWPELQVNFDRQDALILRASIHPTPIQSHPYRAISVVPST